MNPRCTLVTLVDPLKEIQNLTYRPKYSILET